MVDLPASAEQNPRAYRPRSLKEALEVRRSRHALPFAGGTDLLAAHRRGPALIPDLPVPLRHAWLAFAAPHEARHPEHKMVDAHYIAWAQRRGYRVNVWTVDDPDEMCRLIGLGVDGIITDFPDVLRSVLESQQ